MDAGRMAEVYALARKWSLIIIEDDAYYWLQYPDGPDNVPGLNLRRKEQHALWALCCTRYAAVPCSLLCAAVKPPGCVI
jgi:DNA-binding transcriptional MocR family regulator